MVPSSFSPSNVRGGDPLMGAEHNAGADEISNGLFLQQFSFPGIA
jgi:hypothetical protein